MPSRAEHHVLPRRLLVGVVAALLIVGYGLTLWIFYPGIMTYDAKFVYEDIAKGTLGDWQSPVMVRCTASCFSPRDRYRICRGVPSC